jgi:host factor-I protein
MKKGRTPPPDETFEEAQYLKSLGEKQKLVSVKLVDGEVVTGWIEYYDRDMIRLTREGAPNLFIFKHEIMYISEGPLHAKKRQQPRAPESSDAKPVDSKPTISRAEPKEP